MVSWSDGGENSTEEVKMEDVLEYGKKLDEDYRNDSDESVRNALVVCLYLMAVTIGVMLTKRSV